MRLSANQRRAVFHAALLRAIGSTAHASENAAMFGDDVQFERALKELDPADPKTFSARFGDWDPDRQEELLALVIERTPTTGAYAARSGCEVSAALGVRLGIDRNAIAALGHANERWDGRGIPDGRAGDQVDPIARIVHVAEQAVLAHFSGGEAAARNGVARRAGGHLDPELCAEFSTHCEEVLGALDAPDMLAAVAAAEPSPVAVVDSSELERLCLALAIFTDLKGLHLIGHLPRVAELAAGAARLMGMDVTVIDEIHASGRSTSTRRSCACATTSIPPSTSPPSLERTRPNRQLAPDGEKTARRGISAGPVIFQSRHN